MGLIAIACPHCGERIEIEYPEPSGSADVEFVADCEVCCRPIRIVARASSDGGEPWIEATPD
jgi:hypothetical protein